MFEYLSENIVFFLIKNKILDIKDREIYVYGVEAIVLNSLLLIGTLMISICNDMLSHYIGFLIFFIPLRVFVGGYHAKHSESCFLLSLISYAITLWIAKNNSEIYRNIGLIVVMMAVLVIVAIWSPVKNENHPLAEYQYRRNKKIALILSFCEIVVFVILSYRRMEMASSQMVLVLFCSVVFFLGKLNNFWKSNISGSDRLKN